MHWSPVAATVAFCALIDGALLLLAIWIADDVVTALWILALAGAPATIFIAGPSYTLFRRWFKPK